MSTDKTRHFDQRQRRNAELISPPNIVRAKVGGGGLGDEILQKAQEILESNTTDFAPLAEMYLTSLNQAIDNARLLVGFKGDHEPGISAMIYPAMQLKANGGMFHFPMITLLADKKVQFLEVIDAIDQDVLDLANAFIVTIRAVLASQIRDPKNQQGQELLSALDGACRRYFTRHPSNKHA